MDIGSSHVHLVRIEPDAGRWRYYCVYLRPDLFASVALVREWGRIGQGGGSYRVEPFDNRASAHAALLDVVRLKVRRGYQEAGAAP
ncbi:WGR domain-containing protein [Aquisalimonas asiatica]|uniref:WGR domain-containing protein n=1 Tax=Aquisalimonas asiatica TaxID=406100 RepID=UPI000B83ABBB